MPYRIVPVGDKLVLMIEPELQLPGGTREVVCTRAYDAGAGYYDFDVERSAAKEDFSETTLGGASHE